MKQVLQNLSDGATVLADVPAPLIAPGTLLIATSRTLVSAGTERMLVDFGRASLIDKARQQPEKVRMVLEKARTDGMFATLDAVRRKLDQPLALGYCNVGTVVEVGRGVEGFAVGDRVASNGPHAELVRVAQNLCARVPDSVDDESAAFTVLASIGLQGIRLAAPTLGESVVVTGLGLIGLLTVQLLRANGCRVLGIDLDAGRLALAKQLGAEVCDIARGDDPVARGLAFSGGRGVDAVIVTASTQSNLPIEQAAKMSRKRGRIVLVGVTGLELNRADFYEKELTFQVSCSYGPGRYDPRFEVQGLDYPFGFVRWTEQRNFEAVLDMISEGRINVRPLISHRYSLNDAEAAYDIVGGAEPSLGILLSYPRIDDPALLQRTIKVSEARVPAGERAAISIIGSGNYAGAVLIPAFKAAGATLVSVVSSGGVSGVHAGRKFGFLETTTDTEQVFVDARINAVVITTRHDSHAELVLKSLAAGKHVFVEKPLCLTHDELALIERCVRAAGRLLMVGFNRRFAPQVQKIRELLAAVTGPKAFVITVNAGAIPAEHWTQDPDTGGGRILGEACHFIDLLRHLAGSPIKAWARSDMDVTTSDTATLQLEFVDGSIGTVHYFANGAKAFPKERVEVFAAGRVLQLDNFRRLIGFGWPDFSRLALWRQDKGQGSCAAAFIRAIESGGPAPIPLDELLEVSRVTIDIARDR